MGYQRGEKKYFLIKKIFKNMQQTFVTSVRGQFNVEITPKPTSE